MTLKKAASDLGLHYLGCYIMVHWRLAGALSSPSEAVKRLSIYIKAMIIKRIEQKISLKCKELKKWGSDWCRKYWNEYVLKPMISHKKDQLKIWA
jgi:hypothetical protein